jgi:hypothetical protein
MALSINPPQAVARSEQTAVGTSQRFTGRSIRRRPCHVI